MFRLIGVSLLLATLGLSQNVSASEENWFEVEVYVFSRQAADSEQWPEQAVPADTRKAIDLITPVVSTDVSGLNSALNGCTAADWATRPDWCNQQMLQTSRTHPEQVPVTIGAAQETYASADEAAVLLADSQSQFQELISKLSREPGVTGLLHMTWQENMKPRRQAKPIRLYAGKDFGKNYRADGSVIEADNDLVQHFTYLNDFLTQDSEDPVWQLDGTLNIYLNHWLYIETDLVLREEGDKTLATPEPELTEQSVVADDTAEEAKQVPYLYAIHMKQNRRVRSNEMHYFDHPKLGLLIQIRKMEQPSEREVDQESEARDVGQ
ncbi:peptidoglycan binding protein CsiV [Shewanella corallii]|uniref:Peptidoglycan binding protein CsiV n=1 Tax=Shewanella corallii TaxID=560080 RepID=A0ABT0N7J0_9GAMM|nr:peptidoglycan binding protein CsiV [Shewanella corallii]